MDLLKRKIAAARKIYETYWNSYLRGDLETFASTLDDTFEMIGTSETEVCHSKADGIAFFKAQMKEVVGKVEMRNRQVVVLPVDNLMLVNEQCDIYVLTETDLPAHRQVLSNDKPVWTFYSKIRISTFLRETGTGWKVIQQHGSLPDMRVQEGETMAIEKITKENLELKDAVKRRTTELENKSRELEIEASLERVRAVAMGMKTPKDMLDVCRAISDQLQQFGVEKIRNVQTAIIDENIGQYLCYQYFTPYDKTTIEKTEYLKSPVEHGMVRQMLASRDGYFIGRLSGKDLEDFRIHRKEENNFPDPFLDKATELDYCFLSIGEGGLGLTLYQPMAEDVLTLFKRFHQVFSLAYQRFRDIQKAEAQAREAQIEAALERVRAQTMAMHNSEDVGKSVVKMFSELTALGVDEGTRFGIGILNYDNENNQLWTARKTGEEVNMHIGNIDMASHPLLKSARKAWKEQVPLHKYVLEGEDLMNYYQMLNKAPDYKIQIPIEKLPKKEIQHCFIFEHGFFYAFSPREFQPELIHITKRFSALFEQTYRRYLDLVKAESQAREAEIELALERVRARTMAMQHSDELTEASEVLDRQVRELGIETWGCAFHIYADDPEGDYEWFSSREGSLPFYKTPRENFFLKFYEKGKAGETFHVEEFLGEDCKVHYDYLMTIPVMGDALRELVASGASLPESQYDHIAFFKHGFLLFITYKPVPQSQAIFQRFSKVFEQTYTRFLDLQKAEAQAKEAKIEAALERVRSKTMAMHHTEELKEVIQVVFEQMVGLNIHVDHAGFILDYKEREDMHIWLADHQQGVPTEITIPYFDSPHWNSYLEAKAKGESFFANLLPFEVKNKFYQVLFELIPELTEEAQQAIFSKPGLAISTVLLDNVGLYIEHYSETPFTAEENKILMRFGKVFQQTYTRFLDLQKAEAQAREAQIEASLERIRAKAMSMHHSDELDEVLAVLCEQFDTLGIFPMSTHMTVLDIDNNKFTFRETGKFGNRSFGEQTVALDAMDTWKDMVESWKSAEPYSVNRLHFPKDSLAQVWEVFHESFASMPEGSKITPDDYPDGIYHTAGKHPFGYIGMNQVRPATEKEGQIVIKFANEFGRAYQRFLDLKKAEAQAREAQIEAALEKVRSRSLAMHKSDELNEVVSVLFEKLKDLQIPFTAVGIAIRIEGSKDLNGFVCGQNDSGLVITNYRIPYFDNPIPKDLYSTLEKQLDFYVGHYSKEEKDAFYNYVIENTAEFRHLPEDIKRMIFDSPNYTISMVAVKNAVFNINDFEGKVLADKEVEIIQRFSRVFDQAYTRFLDLQKAEAQAKEAQIELSLERIRSQVTAMQESSDLLDIVVTMRTEFVKLGHEAHYFWHMRWLPERYDKAMTSGDGTKIGMVMTLPRHIHGDIPLVADWEKTKEPTVVLAMEIETAVDYVHKMITLGDFEQVDPQAPTLDDIRHIGGLTFVMARTTHGEIGYSLPGVVTDPPKNAVDALIRFAGVFDLAYKRFEDLKSAERQHREAQIELALERVRARTMAMQKSEELADAAFVLFEQLRALGGNLWGTGFGLCQENVEKDEFWFANENGVLPPVAIPNTIDPAHKQMYKGWQKKTDFLSIEKSGAALKSHYEYMLSLPEVRPFFQKIIDEGLSFPEKQQWNAAFFSKGYLLIITLEPYPEPEIFKRFAKVFEQTYTRFLDLQRAETQAREAKIEAALEKVRSRTMGMQSSDELPEVANLLFTEVRSLGIPAWSCGYNILAEDKKTATAWMSSEGIMQTPFQLRLFGEASFDEMGKFILSDHTMFVQELGGKALEVHYAYMKTFPDLQSTFKNIEEQGLSLPTFQINHLCKFTSGFLLFITYEPVPDAHGIFKRFTNVFDQTYTRFLDLQKAETQAKEARIEAALERVRSRTMGMQKAEELGEVATVLFREMNALVENLWTCGFVLCEKNRNEDEWWLSLENGLIHPFFLPNVDDFAHSTLYEGWNKGELYRTVTLENAQLQEHYDWLMSIPIAQQIFEDMESSGIPRPNWQRLHAAYFKTGYLVIITEVPCEEEEIFKRFAQVFDLTYTRFLDLQKAEKQAREAQIENALEKVRSRSLAMQSPNELIEVAQLLREEMGALGVEELETSSIYIQDESSGLTQCWFTIKNPDNPGTAITDQMVVDLQDTWVGRKMDEFYRSKAKQTSILMQGEERIEWIRYCEEKSDLFGTSNFYGETIPDRTYHLYKFSNGYIGAAAPGEISPESWELLKRATAVFSFAYTRFRDLQMAQASARTAMRQASLDRVRADISSMRNADDLDRITPLIFKELTVLGVPFIRCGVFIIQEKQKIVEAYLSSPEGNSLGVLRLPYKASELTYQTVEAWRKGEVYKQHWNKEDFVQWIKQLMEQDQIQDGSTYQGTAAPPESLDLHFVPFAQGMLYVGAVSPLDEKELELVQTLAKAFSIAYARFEDFVKLEQAKAEVESAMSELKATQSQLVQQEKLASLGQLTAGIAHEIKNPLNFVNNFSEVSIEMIEEIKEERAKSQETRDETLVDEILEDIQSNLGKIHEHGSRANGIVTSMLQHSRGGSGKMEPTDLNALIKEYVNLSFHGMRAGKNPINVEIALDLDPDLEMVSLIKEDFTRVIINLCNNAFDAMRQKTLQGFQPLGGLDAYHPKLTVITKTDNNHILIEVADNGPGIPNDIKDKILQPFFTTKKGTEGTGLGLSITHDIIKAHGGELKVETKIGEGTAFIIQLENKG